MTIDFSTHPQWPALCRVLNKIQQKGFVAYLAGGSVRDALLGRPVSDFDIATSAQPEEIHELFPTALDVGKNFGVMIVKAEGFTFEVASFRKDGLYVDGRRPQEVEWSTPEEDAARRDFTVNGLFYDPLAQELHDFVGGKKDLERRVLRTVGAPLQRFAEDKLRLLRGIRFMAQLDFTLESHSEGAIKSMLPEVMQVSPERRQEELKKMLSLSHFMKSFWALSEWGYIELEFPIWKNLKPGLSGYWGDVVQVYDLCHQHQFTPIEKWTTLFAFVRAHSQKVSFKELRAALDQGLARLKFSNAERLEAEKLLLSIELFQGPTEPFRWLKALNEDYGKKAHEVLIMIEGAEGKGWRKRVELLRDFSLFEGKLPKPLIDGNDLKALGIKPGPNMRSLLDKAYEAQLFEGLQNKDELVKKCHQT